MKKLLLVIWSLCLCTVVFSQQKYHDAAMFNVHKGNVKCIEYEAGTVNFSEDGKLIKDGSSYLSLYTQFDIIRNNDGYPIELITNFDKTTFEYDDEGRISKRVITSANNVLILSYKYGSSYATITRTDIDAGRPKTTETTYDLNDYDARGNCIQRGIKGTTVREQNVSVDYLWAGGNSWRQWTSVENEYRTEGEIKETRKITFWLDNVKPFQRSDSQDEINLFTSISNPFFFGVGTTPKEVEKYIKKNGVEHKRKESGYKGVAILMPKSDKVFFGYPVSKMCYEYNQRYKSLYNYKFDIIIEDEKEREALFDFIYAEAHKNKMVVREKGGYVELKKNNNSVHIKLIPNGIEVNQDGSLIVAAILW